MARQTHLPIWETPTPTETLTTTPTGTGTPTPTPTMTATSYPGAKRVYLPLAVKSVLGLPPSTNESAVPVRRHAR